MINSIDEYLLKLKKELSGCDPVTIQNALFDSKEHLSEAFSSALDLNSNRSGSEILQEVIENYGTPAEIAATYKEMEARRTANIDKKGITISLVAFISTLATSIYLFGQGLILVNWDQFNGDGFTGMEDDPIFRIWALLCLAMAISMGGFALYIWKSFNKKERDIPQLFFLFPILPFLAQGIALLCYWSTREPGWQQRESGTALIMGILSLSLAFVLLIIWIVAVRYKSLTKKEESGHYEKIYPERNSEMPATTYTYASLIYRFIAVFIDGLVLFPLSIPLIALITIGVIDITSHIFVLVIFFINIIYCAYFVYFEYMRGQTVGKGVMRIKVISESGDLTLKSVLIRNIYRFASGMLGIANVGFLSYIWTIIAAIFIWKTAKKQRPLDILAGTIVVRI